MPDRRAFLYPPEMTVARWVRRGKRLRPTQSTFRAWAVILIAALATSPLPTSRASAGPASTISTSAATPGGLPYGPGIAADGLANTQVGGTSCGCPNLVSAYRFRAGQSAVLAAIRIYIIKGKPGYSGGTGGSLQIDLRPDNGSTDHRPATETLASMTVSPEDGFPRYAFPSPATVVAGQLYHVVFTNVDPSPTVNFVSVNALHVSPPITAPRQARFDDTDWAQLMDEGAGWVLRPEYTPILELDYANEVSEGVGYMEVWIGATKTISGVAQARETFKVSGGDRTVTSVAVRLHRISGSGPLTIRLETPLGEPLEEGVVPADAIGLRPAGLEGASWATMSFAGPRVLHDGQTYDLVLSSPADTAYGIHVIRKGSSFGFAPATYFADGSAQYNPGSGWVAFDPGWRGPLEQGDLQLVFR